MSDEAVAVKIIDTLKIGDVSSIAVATTGVAYGASFPLPRNATFAHVFKFASPGFVNVKIELEQSDVRPATEGSADSNYVVPTSGGEVSAGIIATTVHRVPYAPKVSGYARYKFTGLASGNANDAGTTVTQAQCVYVQ